MGRDEIKAAIPAADLLSVSAMTLATRGPGGAPHAAAVYFAADERLHLYFFSDPESQHARDLIRDRRAAVAFHPECEGWEDIRGVQMRGEVRAVPPGETWDRAWDIYVDKFPFVSDLQDAVAQNQLYVFVPHWIRLVDNRKGFGFKQEWALNNSG